MLGLLLERQRIFCSARAAFQKGLEESLLQNSDPQELDAIRCNLGRVLINLQDYQQSIDVLKTVNHPSFASQSSLALALFKGNDLCFKPFPFLPNIEIINTLSLDFPNIQLRNLKRHMRLTMVLWSGWLLMTKQKR